MTSRELCRRAIEFRRPDRLPLNYPSCNAMDFAVIAYTAPTGWQPSEPGEDEWGCVWKRTSDTDMGQIVKHPLADWEAAANYCLPAADAPGRFDQLEQRMQEFPDHYIIVVAETVLTLWERFYALRGFDQALMDPYLYPEETHALLERILDYHIGIVRGLGRHFQGRIDGFFISDDWGTSSNTLFPLDVWREFFKERYRRLFRAMHEEGIHAIFHSDGHINDYLDDLIEIGVDALNLHSPNIVGIEEVGRKHAGKVAFIPCIDLLSTYVHGSVEDVRREAGQLLAWWGTPEGGIIPSEYDHLAVGAPIRNVHAACERFQELGMAHCGAALSPPSAD